MQWPSLTKSLFLVFLLSTYKTLPFAYLYRFYSTVLRNVVFKRFTYLRNGGLNTYGYDEGDNRLVVFKPQVFKTYVSPLEVDMYLHKLNLTYFLDLDIARTDLITKVFQKLFFRYYDNANGHFKGNSLANLPYIPVAAVETHFKHELKPFQSFEIHSKVISWDQKWIFVLSKFTSGRKADKVYGIALTKYVFKRGRVTIAPEDMIKECGLWTPECQEVAFKNRAIVDHMTDLEDLERAVGEF